jgi:hypothetical protein
MDMLLVAHALATTYTLATVCHQHRRTSPGSPERHVYGHWPEPKQAGKAGYLETSRCGRTEMGVESRQAALVVG